MILELAAGSLFMVVGGYQLVLVVVTRKRSVGERYMHAVPAWQRRHWLSSLRDGEGSRVPTSFLRAVVAHPGHAGKLRRRAGVGAFLAFAGLGIVLGSLFHDPHLVIAVVGASFGAAAIEMFTPSRVHKHFEPVQTSAQAELKARGNKGSTDQQAEG